MAEKRQHSESVWDRLRRNRERNTQIFIEAGVRAEYSRDVICPACGAQENAVFWSVAARSRRTLHLLCPICEQARVGYSLAKNRPVDRVITRGSVGGGMGVIAVIVAIGVIFYFRDSPPVQMIAEDLHNLGGALSGGASRATGGYVGSGSTRSSRPGSGASRAATGPRTSSPPTSLSEPAATAAPSAAGPEVDGSTAPAALRAFVSRGDRRGDVDLYAARIIDQLGTSESRLLLEVEYDPETNMTRVLVDPSSTEWPRRLSWLRGWRAASPSAAPR